LTIEQSTTKSIEETGESEEDLETDNLESFCGSSSISRGKEKVFSIFETQKLVHLSREIIITPPINNERIQNVLTKTKEGKKFLVLLTINQLRNKIKYGKYGKNKKCNMMEC